MVMGELTGKPVRAIGYSVAPGADDCARRSGIVTEYDGEIPPCIGNLDIGPWWLYGRAGRLDLSPCNASSECVATT